MSSYKSKGLLGSETILKCIQVSKAFPSARKYPNGDKRDKLEKHRARF